MNKIKILHIIRTMNMGGAQVLIMNILRNIDKEKFQFDFLLNEEGIFDDEIRKLGGEIFYTPYLTEIGQLKYKRDLIKFFVKHKEYKIVHSHMNQVSGIIMEAAYDAGVPTRIAHSHTMGNKNNIIAKIYKRYLQEKIGKYATHLIACSTETAKWMFKKRAQEALIIKNGIDIDKFQFSIEERKTVREELGLPENTIVIGNVGRFSAVKNHVFMIKVFKEFRKNFNSKLLLIGEGELKEKIIELAKHENILQDVIFKVEKNNVQKFYNIMDIYMCPSLYEGIPLTLIEAQTNGVPIIASDTVDSKVKVAENFVFESLLSSSEIWCEKMKKILNVGRKNNIENIEEAGYNIKNQTAKLENFYDTIYER